MQRRTLLISLAVILLVVAGVFAFAYKKGFVSSSGSLVKDSGENISDFSAVFLTNGQVYFGKLYGTKQGAVDLREIYYLQVNQALQNSDGTTKAPAADPKEPNVVLVKLGEELHGPNDRMQINKDQVLFTESLKNGSKVVDAIKNYQK